VKDGRRRALAGLLVALAAMPVALRYLVFWPLDQWQVDVEVYREAGVSVLTGRPIYLVLTEAPQLLPFTYPPFAALLAVPLAFVPFGVAGWLWTVAQVVAVTLTVALAAGPLLERTGARRPLVLALLAAPILWLHPVSDGVRFGQVNAFLVLLCLADLRRPRARVLARVPAGMLVGLAMAIKLTPGVFVVHYLVCRRWKEAATAIGTAVAVTLGTWLVLPGASFAFWGGALQDPSRLGPNAGTANQAIRGVLLRIGPEGTVGTVLWLVLALAVATLGFWLARRFWLAGASVAEVGTVGLVACLVSPVAWVHHYHWVVPAIFALLGAGPWVGASRARAYAAGLVTVWFLCRLPWWGISWLNHRDWPRLPGRLLQNAGMAGGLLALGLLWWTYRRFVAGSAADDAGELEDREQRHEQADRAADPA
jgi:alpha-1,2-mannosyltransferase